MSRAPERDQLSTIPNTQTFSNTTTTATLSSPISAPMVARSSMSSRPTTPLPGRQVDTGVFGEVGDRDGTNAGSVFADGLEIVDTDHSAVHEIEELRARTVGLQLQTPPPHSTA
jgi:hypothetical protein